MGNNRLNNLKGRAVLYRIAGLHKGLPTINVLY